MKLLVDQKHAKFLLGESGPSEFGFHHIEAIARCHHEYLLGAVRKIHTVTEYNPDHFSVGSIFHAGRARWFSLDFATSAKAWRKIRDACARECELQRLPVTFKAEALALRYVAEYIEYWQLRPRPKSLAAEYLLGPAPLKPSDPFYMFRTAKLDDVSKYDEAGGELCIGESKTTSGSIQDCINQYTLHGQPLLQYVLWVASKQGEATLGPAAGTVLDITQKGSGRTPSQFRRVFMPWEPRVLKWFSVSMRGFLRDAARLSSWDTYARRNFASCTRMGGRGRVACTYRDLCMFGREARGQYVIGPKDLPLKEWKPSKEETKLPWDN